MGWRRGLAAGGAMVAGLLLATPAAGEAAVWNHGVLEDARRQRDRDALWPMRIVGARNGVFSGAVAVESAGPIVGLPVELSVSGWRVPDPEDWRTWTEMIQSPDTLALEYDVPLWSDRHFELIGASFRRLRELCPRRGFARPRGHDAISAGRGGPAYNPFAAGGAP
jgi:hypothetical protein